jgi:mediator of RNA polymerase II transcription subunit 6
VLYYFATSPFFDRSSGNQSLWTQFFNTEHEGEVLGSRARFEANLRQQRGIQYVVEQAPMEPDVFVDGPHGRERSAIWVIRKQDRLNEHEATPLAYYYIVNNVIFQAPSIAAILNNRLVCTSKAWHNTELMDFLDECYISPQYAVQSSIGSVTLLGIAWLHV